jgi:hypothetical protein
LAKPEGSVAKPAVYDVGVHYWRDHGWGDSFAEVWIYIVGQLIWQEGPVKMRPWDMWHVGRVIWPNVMVGGTAEPFLSCRQSGDLCAAGSKAKKWLPKGKSCMTACYKPKQMTQSSGLPGHCK